jgi:site-specific DNA recombinase
MNGLRSGHRILAGLGGSIGRPETLGADQTPLSTYERRLACLAFLAPDIQAQILEGRHPPGLTLEGVLSKGVPLSWEDQRMAFGFPCRSVAA